MIKEIVQPNTVTVIVGDRGFGKSNLSVGILFEEYKLTKRKIYSNIKLKGIKYYDLTPDMLISLSDELESCILFIDELHMYADSYDFLSNHSKLLTTLFTQLRKRNITLIATTQYFDTLPKRIRRLTDYVIESFPIQRTKLYNKPIYSNFTNIGIIKYKLGYDDFRELKIIGWDARKYYNNYDTNEIVIPEFKNSK